MKQPWRIWLNESHAQRINDVTTTWKHKRRIPIAWNILYAALCKDGKDQLQAMMTSWNGNIFQITRPLRGCAPGPVRSSAGLWFCCRQPEQVVEQPVDMRGFETILVMDKTMIHVSGSLWLRANLQVISRDRSYQNVPEYCLFPGLSALSGNATQSFCY